MTPDGRDPRPGTASGGVGRPWVIVPIYNARDAVVRCLDSLQCTLRPDDAVLLADDASPDPAMADLLSSYCERMGGAWRQFRQPRNLGFVGNVNEALRYTAGNDVILLNSDTVTTAGWLDRIIECAASDATIATITPWSNNAEICSFPDFCRANPEPSAAEAERIATAAAGLETAEYAELPTGVGFAMYLRRRAIEVLGDFDLATFGRGYGEENDFCFRVARHGWRNVLCHTAYVVHAGHASFAETGHRPGGENLLRLLARYPDYNARIARYIADDPLRPLRDRLVTALADLQQRLGTPA